MSGPMSAALWLGVAFVAMIMLVSRKPRAIPDPETCPHVDHVAMIVDGYGSGYYKCKYCSQHVFFSDSSEG
jgi:hypothetical protein